MKIEREIEITATSVLLDGKPVQVQQSGEKMLVGLYRRYVGDYPKFFKMDTLSRLGFIAAELLLYSGKTDAAMANNQSSIDAIILANSSASIKNDRDYLATITEGNYYPSPALFVYTLPNIVTGEIAIRHHIQGETSFYILEKPEQLLPIIKATINALQLSDNRRNSAMLCGWCECSASDEFYAKMQILLNN